MPGVSDRLLRIGVLAMLVVGGCARAKAHGEFEDLGIAFASSELPPGLYPPVHEADLPAIQERGQLVYAMERALKLAYEDAMLKAGDPHAVAVLPLVQIDPGGESGQVVFVRWPTPPGGTPPKLTVDNAERWLLASIRLNPDSVIDVELLTGSISKESHDARRITSLIAAAEALRAEVPDALFHLLDIYEVVPSGKKVKSTKTVSHVYALSADGDGPDLEAVVDEVPKRGAPDVLSVGLTHAPGKGTADPIVVSATSPAPLTVARALLRGPTAGEIIVLTDDDKHWVVDARTGSIARPGEAPDPGGS